MQNIQISHWGLHLAPFFMSENKHCLTVLKYYTIMYNINFEASL